MPSAVPQRVHLLEDLLGVLPGLHRYREASLVAAEGLKLDPFNQELKKMSEEATRGTLKDLLTGVFLEAHLLRQSAALKASPCNTRVLLSLFPCIKLIDGSLCSVADCLAWRHLS